MSQLLAVMVLKKNQLKEQFSLAQRCLQDYERLKDESYQKSQQDIDILNKLINEYEEGKPLSFYDLLVRYQDKSLLAILCTAPNTAKQKKAAVEILSKVIDKSDFTDSFLKEESPGSTLLKEAIAGRQEEILIALVAKVSEENPLFIQYVEQNALLHYAAEQGLNSVFTKLLDTLKNAGASEDKIFELLLNEYGPGASRKKGAPYIKWATNCLDIAIRNYNWPQLEAMLKIMPADVEAQAIHRALHLCAVLGNKTFFDEIVTRYNEANPAKKLGTKEIIGMKFPPDDLSPYHLFLRDKATSNVIDELAKEPQLAKEFLAISAEFLSPMPMTIAARNGNFSAVTKLIALARTLNLLDSDWVKFFTQSDEEGKTVLNYILEKGQLKYLKEYLATIKDISPQESANILVHLLSNPDPVNPLKNYLDTKIDPAQQFKIVKRLLNAICDNYKNASEEQERARIVALLFNQNWFIAQAESPMYHAQLRDLLQNSALSFSSKKTLFEKLKDATPSNSVAEQFYEKLLDEVYLPAQEETIETIRVDFAQVRVDLAKQTSDVSALIRALVDDHRQEDRLKEYEKAKEEAERELSRLRDENFELSLALLEKNVSVLKIEEAIVAAQQEQKLQQAKHLEELEAKEKELTGALDNKAELAKALEALKAEHQQAAEKAAGKIEVLTKGHGEKVSELEELLKKQEQTSEEALVLAKEQYEFEQARLQKELEASKKALDEEKGGNSELEKLVKQLEQQLHESKISGEQAVKELTQARDEKVSQLEELLKKQEQTSEEALVLAKEQHEFEQARLQKELEASKKALDEEKGGNSELEKLVKQLEQQLHESKISGEQAVKELTQARDEKVSQLEELLKKQEQTSEEALVLAKEQHEFEQARLQKELEASKKALDEEKGGNSELEKLVKQLEQQLHESKISGEQAVKELTQARDEKVSQLEELLKKQERTSEEALIAAKEEHKSVQDRLQKTFEEKEKAHESSNKGLKEKSEVLQDELAELKKELAIAKEKKAIAKEEKAIKVLKYKIKNIDDVELLKNIAQAKSNADLRSINGLKAKYVNALKSEHAFEKIADAAYQRLDILSHLALQALEEEVRNLKDPQLLKQIANLGAADEPSNEVLLDLGLNDNNVAALRNNGYQIIAEVAKERLVVLDKHARDALREQVKTRVDINFLRALSHQITNNEDLIKIAKLDSNYVYALQDPDFYKELMHLATERIGRGQQAYKYLEKLLETTNDQGLLHSISRARNNADLKIGFLPEDVDAVDDLVNINNYSDLAEVAERRLDVLKSEEERLIRESVVVKNPYQEAQEKAVAALKEVISKSKDDEMLTTISEANTSDALEDAGLNPKLVRRVFEEKAFLELTLAAEERLERLQERRGVRKEIFLTPDRYQHALTKKGKEKKLTDAEANLLGIIGLDKNLQEELRTLAGLSPIHIFNPGFQAAAKKHADELGIKYDNLAKNCTSMVEYLKVLRADLRDQLASLPTDADMRASPVPLDRSQQIAIRQRRHLIGRILAKIEPELALHAPLQRLFHGDRKADNPLLQQGLVKTIKQARASRFNLNYLGFSSDFENFGMEDKSTFFRKDYVPKTVGTRGLSLVGHKNLKYQAVHALKPGQGRIHTINPDKPKVAGTYIEEQQASFAVGEHRKLGSTAQGPRVKFTVTKFPEGSESDPAVVTARVQFAIGMASEMLARYDVPPSRKSPLGLVSGTPLEQKYVGTALILLGQQVPFMKFDHHAISVPDPSIFNPETELVKGFFGGYSFSDKSFYATHFKGQVALQTYLDGVKEAMTDKYGHQKTRDKVKGVLEKIEQVFLKPESTRTVEKVERDLGKPPRVP